MDSVIDLRQAREWISEGYECDVPEARMWVYLEAEGGRDAVWFTIGLDAVMCPGLDVDDYVESLESVMTPTNARIRLERSLEYAEDSLG